MTPPLMVLRAVDLHTGRYFSLNDMKTNVKDIGHGRLVCLNSVCINAGLAAKKIECEHVLTVRAYIEHEGKAA